MAHLSSTDRAKQVLDICAHELHGVDVGDQATLEFAIRHQIDEAIRDHMIVVNKMIITRADSIRKKYADD